MGSSPTLDELLFYFFANLYVKIEIEIFLELRTTCVKTRVFAQVLFGGEQLVTHLALPFLGLVGADVLLQILVLFQPPS